MVKVYYSTYFDKPGDEAFSRHLSRLPETFHKKILAYRRWEDKTSSLYGKLLLIKGLEDLGIVIPLSEVKYSPFGRPYLADNVDFNISHSGNLVACAFATSGNIGLDLEEIKPIDLEIFNDHFSKEEWSAINSSDNKYEEFYRLWTIKEAALKSSGDGLNIPLLQVSVQGDKVKVKERELSATKIELVNNYSSHIVTDSPIKGSVEVYEVKF
jgi:4'-phosphopantetheinyl transferase